MLELVSSGEARASFMAAFATCTPDQVAKFREVTENGGLNGSVYHGCGYAKLASACGVYIDPCWDAETSSEVLANFWAPRGVTIRHNRPNDNIIERFCIHIKPEQTLRDSDELAHIAMWCDEYLGEIEEDLFTPEPNGYNDEKLSSSVYELPELVSA